MRIHVEQHESKQKHNSQFGTNTLLYVDTHCGGVSTSTKLGLYLQLITHIANPQTYKILPASQSLVVGGTLSINGVIGGSLNVYKWYKNNTPISGATSAIFAIPSVATTDAGTYKCEVTSIFVGAGTTTGVTITSSNVTVTVSCPTITVNPTASALTYTVGSVITNINLSTTGGVAPYTYAISAGALPANVNIANGVISGNPTTAGNGTFTVRATDANSCTGTRVYTFTVNLVGTPMPPVVPPVVLPNPATSIDNSLVSSVKVSPNPSSNDFNVDFGNINMTKSLVRVYDAQGKVVFTSENNANNSNKMIILLGDFANGIYLLQINAEKGSIWKKLVKVN